MRALDVLGVLALLLALGIGLISARRFVLQRRSGSIDLSLRLRRRSQGRGWALGVGRYDDDRLLWWRVFSLAPRPRRTIPREGLRVVEQRRPVGPEALNLLGGSVVLECRGRTGPVELALSESAVPGFLAWLEAAPTRGPEIT